VRVALSLGLLGVVLLGVGSYWGLFLAPPDRFMGDVMRIMYVHVPAAWTTLLCFTLVFGAAIVRLVRRSTKADALLEAGIEVGLVLGVLLVCLGSIWARPTWGVWWDWDPRLTSVAVMLLAFGGIAALRALVEDPVQRATWSAVASVAAYVNIPIVYFSVRWWRSLHQVQSSPRTVDADMVIPLRVNAFAFLFLAACFIAVRYRIARRAQLAEEAG
jgi:heme exporter protein C